MRRVTTPSVSRDRPPAEWDRHFAAIAKDGKSGHEPDSKKSEAKPEAAPKVKAAKPAAKPVVQPAPSAAPERAEADAGRRKLDLLRRRKRNPTDDHEATCETGAPVARAAEPEEPAAATPPWGDGWTTRSPADRPRTQANAFEAAARGRVTEDRVPSEHVPRERVTGPEPRTPTDRPWDRLRRLGWPEMTAPRAAVAAALLIAASGAAAAYVTAALENDEVPGQSAADHDRPTVPAVTRELVSARTPEFVTVAPASPTIATPEWVARPAISVPPPPTPSQLAEIPEAPVLSATAGPPPGRSARLDQATLEPGRAGGWSPEVVSASSRPPSRAAASVSLSSALRPLSVPDAPAGRPRPVSVPGASPQPDAMAMPRRVYEAPAAGPESVEAAAVEAPSTTGPVERSEPAAVSPDQRPSPAAGTPDPQPDGTAPAPSAAASAEPAGQAVTRGDPLVGSVQRALRQAGMKPGPIDGIVGDRTRAAIRDYQTAAGIEATGEIGPELVSRLTAADPLPVPSAQAAAQPLAIDEALTVTPEPARQDVRSASAGPREAARSESRPAAAQASTRAPESEAPIEGMARVLAELFGLPTEGRRATMASAGRPDGSAGGEAAGSDSGGVGGAGTGGGPGGSGGASDSGASDSGASDSGASDSGASDSGASDSGGSAGGGSGAGAGSGSDAGSGDSSGSGSGSGGSGSSGSDSGDGDADSGDTGDVGDVAGDVGEAVGGVAGSVGEAVGGVAGSVGEAVGGVAGAVGGAVGGGGGGPGGGEGGGRR